MINSGGVNKIRNILLALSSGVLLGISWYVAAPIIFIAFIPLLILANNISNSDLKKKGLNILGLSYFAFLIWNLIVTWWVACVEFGKEGALLAFVANSLLMSALFLLWYRTEKRIFGELRFWLLIPFWIAFEYLHHCWELSWPWLTLGNVFANSTNLVQWYEFTGTSGGSLWVLLVNILIAKLLIRGEQDKRAYLKPVFVMMIPVMISYLLLGIRSVDSVKKVNVTVIQPNIDPYHEKFDVPFSDQLDKLHNQLSRSHINRNTQLVVLPETFVVSEDQYNSDVNESQYAFAPEVNKLDDLVRFHFPKAAILTGAGTSHDFTPGEELSSTARKYHNSDRYYDSYNTAVYSDTSKQIQFYHKSKLVPGVEIMPFRWIFKYFEQYAMELGGTTGSLGVQKERTVLEDRIYNIKIAPAVCYESIYSDFMAEYIRNGAEVIAIITNDGWWQNTPGHRQHLSYAKLRAIETRKQIIRSANTGISCFIDEFGNVSQPQPYWEFGVINADVPLNSTKTLFVITGDIISYLSALSAVIFFFYAWFRRFKRA
jgi:apolipoprotein N-acyltransferase